MSSRHIASVKSLAAGIVISFSIIALSYSAAYAQEETPVLDAPVIVDEIVVDQTPAADPAPIEEATAPVEIAPSDIVVDDTTTDATPVDTATAEVAPETTDAQAASAAAALPSPTLTTDKADYAPGETVTIWGKFFSALQNVVLVLVGTAEDGTTAWNDSWTATAGNDGSFTTQRDLPNFYVPLYLLAANSQTGELIAKTDFTDAINISNTVITVKNAGCTVNKTSFNTGDTACASVAVTIGGGGGGTATYFIQWYRPDGSQAQQVSKTVSGNTTDTDTLAFNGVNAVAGTWTIKTCKSSGTSCTVGSTINSTTTTVASPAPKTDPILSITNSPVTYNGSTQAATVVGNVAGVVSNVKYGGSATVPTNVGSYAVTADFAPTDTTLYNNLTNASAGSFVINKANQTITPASVPTSAAFNATFPVSATSNSGLTVSINVSGSCSLAAGTVTMTSGTGTCHITYDQAGNSNYNAATQAFQDVTATKKAQTITAASVPSTAAYSSTFPVSATSDSGLTVSINATGSCSLTSGTITITSGTGSCHITYDQAGNGNYSAATQVFQDVIATKKSQTITQSAVPASAAYLSTFPVSASADSGLTVTIGVSGSCSLLSGTVTMTSGTGGCHVTYDQAGDGNYAAATSKFDDVSASKAPTVTTLICTSPVTYSAAAQTPCTATVTGVGGLNDSVDVVYSNNTNAGSASASATYAGTANYAGSSDSKNFTIAPRAITVTPDSGQSKTYGGVEPTLAYTITAGSLAGSDTLSGALSRDAGENAGSYPITQGTLAASSNYTLSFTSGVKFTINPKALTFNAVTDSKVYDGNTSSSQTPNIVGLVGSDHVTGLTQSFDLPTVGPRTLIVGGSYTIVDGNSGHNYLTPVANTATGSITAKSLGTVLSADNKTYDATTDATAHCSLTGVVGTDAVSCVVGSASFDDANVGTGKTVHVSGITLSGADEGNYSVAATGDTTADITQRSVTVTADNKTKTYGDPDPSLTYSVTGGSVAGSDTFSGSLSRAAGEDVGSYGITLGTLSLGSNYILSLTPGAKLTIGQATLTLTAQTNTKTYDGGTSAAAIPSVSGLKFADKVTNLHEVYTSPNAGSNKQLTVLGGYSILHADDTNAALNYSVSAVADNTGVINKADANCTVTGYSVTYDKTAHTAIGSCTGVADEPLSGFDASGTTHTNAGSYTDTWTFTDVTGNYSDDSDTVSDTISKAAASCSVSGYTGVYDGAAHGASGTCSGIGGENAGTLNLGASFSDVPGGTAHWVFTGNSNYLNQLGDASIVISQATSNTAITCPASVVYNGAAQTPCTVAVTGANLNLTPAATYSNNTNVGSANASYTYAGDTNHTGSSDSKNFDITKANASCTVTGYSVTYDTNPHTATGSCKGVLNETLAGLDLSGTTHTAANDYPTDPWSFTDVTGNYNNTSGTVHDSIGQKALTITPENKSVQYSDPTPNLTTNVNYSGFAGGDNASSLSGTLVCTSPRTVNDPAGTYDINCSGLTSSNYAVTYVKGTLTVTKENTAIDNTTDSFFVTAGPTITTAQVPLSAHLTQEADGNSGDITRAKVKFLLHPIGGGGDVSIDNVPVNASGDALTTLNVPVGSYQVTITITSGNLYWTQQPSGSGTLEVTPGSTDQRVTGGGWVADGASRNGKDNFGFTVYYNKSGAPKGNFLYMFRGTDGFDYQIKSNSWAKGGLSFNGTNGAYFSAKATMTKINQITGVAESSDGSFTFGVNITDNGTSKTTPDKFSITIFDGSNNVWKQLGTSASQISLGGGNVTVQAK